MQIERLKKHGMIAAAVSAAVALAACDQGGSDQAQAPHPPSQAANQGGGSMASGPAARSGDTTAGERAGAMPGATPPTAQSDRGDGASMGDRAQAAADDAQSAAGDAAITAKVKSALVAEDDVRSLAINVDTDDGRVVLEGEVPSAEQSMRIEKLAQNVEGVTAVENKLKVKGS